MSDSLENYELVELLAPGVHRALCKRGRIRGRHVAVKMIPYTTADEIAKLERAALLHRSIHHPAVAALFSTFRATPMAGSKQQRAFVQVIELCDKGTLATLRANRPKYGAQREALLRTVVAPLADALRSLEQETVVHGDICPKSILLTEGGRPKLSRFDGALSIREDGPTWSKDVLELGRLLIWFLCDDAWESLVCQDTSVLLSKLPTDCSRDFYNLVELLLRQDSSQIRAATMTQHPFFSHFFVDRLPTVKLSLASQVELANKPNGFALRVPNALRREPTCQEAFAELHSDRKALRDLSNVVISTQKSGIATKPRASFGAATTAQRLDFNSEQLQYPHSPPRTEALKSLRIPNQKASRQDFTAEPHERLISTRGLPSKVYKTSNGSLTFQSNGTLLIDLREGDRRAGGRGDEVLLVAADGQTVKVFAAPHLSVPCVLSEPSSSHDLDRLPSKYTRTISFAQDFVDGLRRRTPKALFTLRGTQCSLMINAPIGDIEVKFDHTPLPESTMATTQRPALSRHRIVISRSRGTIELESRRDGTDVGQSKRIFAFRQDVNRYLCLGKDDEEALNSEEKNRLQTAIKSLRLCEAYEAIGFDLDEEAAIPAQGDTTRKQRQLDAPKPAVQTAKPQRNGPDFESVAAQPTLDLTRLHPMSKFSLRVTPRPRMASSKF
ncbi:kinase-like domain-containing protein [Auriculariales sp. MPI-PUGE-AT-0066]|nr:kinase-like domain-containing protein [Auriculariales sp. MPI-PUGE-AT-0066]